MRFISALCWDSLCCCLYCYDIQITILTCHLSYQGTKLSHFTIMSTSSPDSSGLRSATATAVVSCFVCKLFIVVKLFPVTCLFYYPSFFLIQSLPFYHVWCFMFVFLCDIRLYHGASGWTWRFCILKMFRCHY